MYHMMILYRFIDHMICNTFKTNMISIQIKVDIYGIASQVEHSSPMHQLFQVANRHRDHNHIYIRLDPKWPPILRGWPRHFLSQNHQNARVSMVGGIITGLQPSWESFSWDAKMKPDINIQKVYVTYVYMCIYIMYFWTMWIYEHILHMYIGINTYICMYIYI